MARQINLRDALREAITWTNDVGKIYQLTPNPAVLICRVHGLHALEKQVA